MKTDIIGSAKEKAVLHDFETAWNVISGDLAAAFRMSDEEAVRFKNKDVARLICAIPLLAGCENPERTAVAHLGTYILSVRETKYWFNPSVSDNDSIFGRLALIGDFKGGDAAIIKRGMSHLALSMLDDYQRDGEIDGAIGKYNPVHKGAFDYGKARAELTANISGTDCPAMDAIAMIGVSPLGWWGY